jgi:DNA (cytosine-5)-methyltransferase 1
MVRGSKQSFTSVEVCAGGGGQALGLEQAGFEHVALVEIDHHSCSTLRLNRSNWNVIEGDLREFDGVPYQDRSVDLLCGGVPCPPFSIAGKRLGADDERDLFPEVLRLASEIEPESVMIENVRGILDPRFDSYRKEFEAEITSLGYGCAGWRLYNASDFGVPQLRPRTVFVALRGGAENFEWPEHDFHPDSNGHSLWVEPPTVGDTLFDLMASSGWPGADAWRRCADKIAPTIVGGSRKHGGPDLGPTRAKRAWASMGVDGMGIANEPPGPDFPEAGSPKLTVEMVKRLQGFPDEWIFAGRKTASYRQVGNAFPPPVARAVGEKIRDYLEGRSEATAAEATNEIRAV